VEHFEMTKKALPLKKKLKLIALKHFEYNWQISKKQRYNGIYAQVQ